MLTPRALKRTLGCAILLGPLVGCRDRPADENMAATSSPQPLSKDDQAVYQELQSEVSKIINESTLRYAPLQYGYNEGLLQILDQTERLLAGRLEGERPRLLPKLDPEEELDHFRETVRRWEEQTKKKLRAEIDPLKAEVAARKPGEPFHPDFQRRFSQTFDGFVALEVAELRERRNKAVHAAAAKVLAPYRDKSPEAVRQIEKLLNARPYDLPPAAASESTTAQSKASP